MKTRIKDIDGVYYPEYYNWGFWFGIVVDVNRRGDNICYTNSLRDAQMAIDKYLSKKKEPATRIIEYP